MKKVITPRQEEESVFYSDFSGRCFKWSAPAVELQLHFNYGSIHDGSFIELHLTDEEAADILNYIKPKLSKDFKECLQKTVNKQKQEFDLLVESRDIESCAHVSNSIELMKGLLE